MFEITFTYKPIVRALLSPRGAYFISGTPEGGLKERGLIREGGLFTKSNDNDLYDSFLVVLSNILQIQYAILRVKCMNSMQVLSQTMLKLT